MSDEDLLDERQSFRHRIEDSESSRKNITRFAGFHGANHLLKPSGYTRIEELWEDALSRACLVETEYRDIPPLQVSQSSLEESRKSIDPTNRQIEESRRGLSTSLQMHKYTDTQ